MMKEYRIPTILGLLVLLVGLVVGIFLVQSGQVFFLRASPEITPDEVKITNVSDTYFTVSWITQKETSGFIKFGESSTLEQTTTDDRDQVSGQTGSFNTHHITVKNLKPQTRYYFKLGSGGRIFDDHGKPYEIKTASSSPVPPLSDLASGKVFLPEKIPAEGAIVYLSLSNTTPQSTLVGANGSWLIALSTAYALDLAGLASYDPSAQTEEIYVQGGKNGKANAITTTANDNPVSDIILGKSYDFREQGQATSSAQTTGTIPKLTGPISSKFSLLEMGTPTLATESGKLSIINPSRDGEALNTKKPEFSGTGPAGKKIQILIESPQYNGTATVGKSGLWAWTPPADLEPGEHQITITYLGKSFTRNFKVLAAGTSDLPALTATPSATTTPQITPTRAPSPTPTLKPTPTPTTRLTPTLSPAPTAPPSARTAMPATTSGVPTSGDLTPTFLIFIIGLTFILVSLIANKVLSYER